MNWKIQILLIAACLPCPFGSPELKGDDKKPDPPRKVETARDLLHVREMHDQTTWSHEVLAQRYEATFVKLWDALIHRPNKYAVLKEFEFDTARVALDSQDTNLDWGIVLGRLVGEAQPLSRDNECVFFFLLG